ncbi:MAG TPA: PAS domain-containing protein [Acidimicrobiia bacterium]|jgi:PAS domain S-box-containing protein|nr:PAS domain-containing protein [Acidimicrobiia bacterium]
MPDHATTRADDPAGRGDRTLGRGSWESLVQCLADAVLVTDRDGSITYWNDAAERVFGWSAAEALGRSLDLIIPERLRERHWQGYRHVVETGVTRYGDRLLEVPALRRDGEPCSIAFTVTVLTDAAGRVERLVAVIRDDTTRWQDRRRLEAELRELRDRISTPDRPGEGAAPR